MSNKKRILKTVDTDEFLDMPKTAQLLYFHLAIRANSNGFVSAPVAVLKFVECRDEDWELLISMGYISCSSLDYGAIVVTEENRSIAFGREY